MICSIDVVGMYPSITFDLIQQAINCFALPLNEEEKEKIKKCLQMIEFEMKNTFLMFNGQYYQYLGINNGEKKGSKIGGFKSVWLTDVVAAYLLEEADPILCEETFFVGLYQDDGFVVLRGKQSQKDVEGCFQSFQESITTTVGSA